MPISRIETDSLASGLVAPTATALTTASGSAPSYSARAWVNFNGTGTVAIRGSGNVSSITDNAPGDYTVNFTTAMSDVNYCAQFSANLAVTAANAYPGNTATQLAGSVRFIHYENSAATDAQFLYVAIFR